MDYLTFCTRFDYNQRSDMARESYQCFNLCFKVISAKNINLRLLTFLGIKGYAKHAAKR
jgi:hypothetical protein